MTHQPTIGAEYAGGSVLSIAFIQPMLQIVGQDKVQPFPGGRGPSAEVGLALSIVELVPKRTPDVPKPRLTCFAPVEIPGLPARMGNPWRGNFVSFHGACPGCQVMTG